MTETEIWSAIELGEAAKEALTTAIRKIKGAAAWGVWDIFGGGLLATFLKRRKMKEADVYLRQAKDKMYQLMNAVKNFNVPYLSRSETESMLELFDYIGGGIVANVIVQTRIMQIKESAERAREELNVVLAYLHGEADQYPF